MLAILDIRVRTQRIRAVILFFTILCIEGCTSQHFATLIFSEYEERIGDRSGQRKLVKVENFSLEALVLNSKPYRQNKTFFLCIRIDGASGTSAKTIDIYPWQVQLKLEDGFAIRPTAYFDSGYCPSPLSGTSSVPEFDFKKIDQTSVATSRRATEYVFNHFSFKFDISPINPNQDFSLKIGEIKVDGVSYWPDPIFFSKTHGQKELWE